MKTFFAALGLFAVLFGALVPALALCQQSGKACCCKPAPPDALCAPDCCGIEKAAPTTTRIPPLAALTVALAPRSIAVLVLDDSAVVNAPPVDSLVRLHERLATRLPLRI